MGSTKLSRPQPPLESRAEGAHAGGGIASHVKQGIRGRQLLPVLLLTAWAAVLASAGYWLLFSTFMVYDDAGYVMHSLQSVAEAGGLYDRVFSQYGPFYYLVHLALHGLGFPFTHDAGRLWTLALWMTTALACGGLVCVQTGRRLLAVAAFALSFLFLWPLVDEPLHPGGLTVTILAVGLLGAVELIRRERRRQAALLLGLLTGALAMIKINVGAYFGLSVLALSVLRSGNRTLILLLVLGLVAFPFLLMRQLIDASWVLVYAGGFAASAALVVAAASGWPRMPLDRSEIARFAIGLTGSAGLSVGWALLSGSSLSGLFEGLLASPLRHPEVYQFPVDWSEAGLALTGLLTAAAIFFHLLEGRAELACVLTGAARLVPLAAFLLLISDLLPGNYHSALMSLGTPALAAYLIPLPQARLPDSYRAANALLVLVALGQVLHAFPVAGSQISWSTFLLIPLFLCGAWEVCRAARNLSGKRLRPVLGWCGNAAVALLLLLAAVQTVRVTRVAAGAFRAGEPLALPGAEAIHLSTRQASTYRIVTENARAHADMLFSLPGMLSFNLWSGVATPTAANTTHWYSLLSSAQQQEILDRLKPAASPVLLVQRHLVEFLQEEGVLRRSPLLEYLAAEFEPWISVDSYELRVRKGWTSPPLGLAVPLPAEPGESDLRFSLALKPFDRPAAAVGLIPLDGGSPGEIISASHLTFRVTHSDGQPSLPLRFPYLSDGTARLQISWQARPGEIPAQQTLLRFYDAACGVVGEARFSTAPVSR